MDKLGDKQLAVELVFDCDFQAIETKTISNMSGSFEQSSMRLGTYLLEEVMTARNQPGALIDNRYTGTPVPYLLSRFRP